MKIDRSKVLIVFLKGLITVFISFAGYFTLTVPYNLVKNELKFSFLKKQIKIDYKNADKKAQAESLSAIIPSFKFLRDSVLTGEELSDSQWGQYIDYYKKVVEIFPQLADAYGFLGYAYYNLGNYQEAINFLEKAVILSPEMFWFKYNLGLVLFKQKKYLRASYLFEESLSKDSQRTFVLMGQSIAYRQILNPISQKKFLVNRFFSYYEKTKIIYLISLYHLKDFKKMYVVAESFQKSYQGNTEKFDCYAGIALLELKKFNQSYARFKNCVREEKFSYDALRYLLINARILGLTQEMDLFLRKRQTWRGSKKTILSFGDSFSVSIF